MSGAQALDWASLIALGLLGLAMLFAAARLVLGPSLADRILGLDLLTIEALGFVGALTVRTGYMVYLDIALALGLLGFLATVALARYIMARAHGAVQSNREQAGDR